MVLRELRQPYGFAVQVAPAIADMGHIGCGIDYQGRCHRRSHIGALLLVTLVQHPIGVLDACSEQGEEGLRRRLR